MRFIGNSDIRVCLWFVNSLTAFYIVIVLTSSSFKGGHNEKECFKPARENRKSCIEEQNHHPAYDS